MQSQYVPFDFFVTKLEFGDTRITYLQAPAWRRKCSRNMYLLTSFATKLELGDTTITYLQAGAWWYLQPIPQAFHPRILRRWIIHAEAMSSFGVQVHFGWNVVCATSAIIIQTIFHFHGIIVLRMN
ncbi:MAG: hypothetical protein RLZZ292_1213 [Bacteroidota bacterium]